MIIENEACKLNTKYNIFSAAALEIYKNLNKKIFDDFETLSIFKPILAEIFSLHQQTPKVTYKYSEKPTFEKNNKVLLCASGGLDSCYQALYLRERGWEVILFHIENLNAYTNGQEKKCFLEFANNYNFEYITIKFSAKHSSDYKKYWNENSFKSVMTYVIAVDYMINLGIGNISCGDDLGLDRDHQALGTNTGDTNTITKAFIESFGINFIPVDRNVNKAQRLDYLYSRGAANFYNSCVTAGRLTESLRQLNEKKYNIKLDKYCCGSCRKCCEHLLLNKYYNNKFLPEEFERHCWDKAAMGADNIYFDKHLPLETRVKNLIDY